MFCCNRPHIFHTILALLAAMTSTSTVVEAATAADATTIANTAAVKRSSSPPSSSLSPALDTRIVFSDVDGTLVHYPQKVPSEDNNEGILVLPPSSTGMRAVISQATIRKCREIRQQGHVKLVLVSGMRTTTLISRLPYLPRADAYCSEAGGRIFYPIINDADDRQVVRIQPVTFDQSTNEDLRPFGLVEDLEWRSIMEEAAGPDGFEGQDIETLLAASVSKQQQTLSSSSSTSMIPASQRQGPLWDHARELQRRGLVLDTKGYATSFRVTAKQQEPSKAGMARFEALQKGQIPCPPQVASHTNLGSIDFYPIRSGKKNW